jgi:hypothetical protein
MTASGNPQKRVRFHVTSWSVESTERAQPVVCVRGEASCPACGRVFEVVTARHTVLHGYCPRTSCGAEHELAPLEPLRGLADLAEYVPPAVR